MDTPTDSCTEFDEEMLEIESSFKYSFGLGNSTQCSSKDCQKSNISLFYDDLYPEDDEGLIKSFKNKLRSALNTEMAYFERKEILNKILMTPSTSKNTENDLEVKEIDDDDDDNKSLRKISLHNGVTRCESPDLFDENFSSDFVLEKNLIKMNSNLKISNSYKNYNDYGVFCSEQLRQQQIQDLFSSSSDISSQNDAKCNNSDDKFKNITSIEANENFINTHVNQIIYHFENQVITDLVNDNNDTDDDEYDDDSNDGYDTDINYKLKKRRKYLIESIEELIKSLIKSYKETGDVTLFINDTSKWNNLEFTEQMLAIRNESGCRNVSMNNNRTQFRFTLINYLLNEILKRLINGMTCTLRELYYQDPALCKDQLLLTRALHDICVLLHCTPWELGIFSSSKGLIAGSLLFALTDDIIIDCSIYQTIGFLLPKNTAGIDIIDSNAEFILLVEKDTVFEKLLEQKIFEKINREFILITGKGYPDINTRLILRKILNQFKIPIYALMDADPYGIEILLTYSYGSKALSYMSHCLACPEIQWIGVLPSEIELLTIPSIPLTYEDKMRINDLLQRPYINNNIRTELNILLECDRKAEIEGISSFSFNFLVNNYIPNKIV